LLEERAATSSLTNFLKWIAADLRIRVYYTLVFIAPLHAIFKAFLRELKNMTTTNIEKAKKRDLAELIRLIALQPEQIEPNVSMFVQQTIANKCRSNPQDVMSIVNQHIRKEIEKLLVPFDEIFTHDEVMLLISFYKEIRRLISFYQSEAMKKFSKNGRKLFDPIYEAYRQALVQALEK